jgi:DNA-binding IclR family transcriptional regulator
METRRGRRAREDVRLPRDLEAESDLSTREKDRKFIWSLAKGFEILRAFQPGQGPMGNNDLARATGLPKPTVSRLTHTLTELGYLTYLPRVGAYEPSPSILALGYCVLSNLRVRHVVHDQMQQLAALADATVALASRDRLHMIFVDVCTGSSLTSLRLDTGSRVEMVNTATGRAFLAGISDSEREYFFKHFARRYGEGWPALRERIQQAVEEVKSRGFCYVEDEWHSDMRGVGVPLVSLDGTTMMALMCGGPSFALSRERLEGEYGPRLVHMARSLAPMLGRN